MSLDDIKAASDTIRDAMAAARGLERFMVGHDHSPTAVRFASYAVKAYCVECRVVWTLADGEEAVRFDGYDELAA